MTLTYINQGRGGTVVYKDDVSSISFDFEFGGGDCVAIIFIPTPAHWHTSTQRDIAEREAIIAFVAGRALADQVSGGYYTISDNFIELFSRR